jgi:hypothetical protein
VIDHVNVATSTSFREAKGKERSGKREGQRAKREARSAKGKERSAKREGQRAKGKGQRAKREAQRAKGKGQRAKREAQRAKSEAQRAKLFALCPSLLAFPPRVATPRRAVIGSLPLQHRPDDFHPKGTLGFQLIRCRSSSRFRRKIKTN